MCLANVRIDIIIHVGAKVHYTFPYGSLVLTNIDSTLTLLRHTVCSSHLNTFIHISDDQTSNVDSTFTDSDYLNALAHGSGYTLTKNIVERLVRDVAAGKLSKSSQDIKSIEGKQITVVKPEYIIDSPSFDFQANTIDFIWRLIAGCVKIDAYNIEKQER